MSDFKTFSVRKVISKEQPGIDKSDYSKFKYGSRSVAREYGKELGTSLANHLITNNIIDKKVQIVISPSPYMFIPTATFLLKNYVIYAMNPILVKNGYHVIQETKVFRQTGYTAEYGTMSAEKRREMISSETFHTDKEFLKGKFSIFLDDIRVTGAHQERMEEMIMRMDLVSTFTDCIFAYYAELTDPTSDATIEDHLNLFAIKGLLDLDKIIKNDEFTFNTRNVKYILNADHVDCVNFLKYQKESFREHLYREALGNSYHLAEEFKLNFQYLKYLIDQK